MLFAKNVQKLMSKYVYIIYACSTIQNWLSSVLRTLDLPTTEYTLADLRAMMGGSYHSVPVSKGMREFIKLEDTLWFVLICCMPTARVGGKGGEVSGDGFDV